VASLSSEAQDIINRDELLYQDLYWSPLERLTYAKHQMKVETQAVCGKTRHCLSSPSTDRLIASGSCF
jgi:hypothetical protein